MPWCYRRQAQEGPASLEHCKALSEHFVLLVGQVVCRHGAGSSATTYLRREHSRQSGGALLLRRRYVRFRLTYAPGFANTFDLPYREAVKVILASEFNFRRTTVLYGQALMQKQATAAYAPEATLPERSAVVEIIAADLTLAMELCADDYRQEIEATVTFVAQGLAAASITEGRQW